MSEENSHGSTKAQFVHARLISDEDLASSSCFYKGIVLFFWQYHFVYIRMLIVVNLL